MRNVAIEKTLDGFFIIRVNGRIVRNPRRCPQGAATYATEEEARKWLEENMKGK